jgi:hypothetical protein
VPTLPQLDKKVNLSPHVLVLGAGASIASYLHSGRIGKPLPSMADLIDTLALRQEIEAAGIETGNFNFEAFYDEIATSGEQTGLRLQIEERVYRYFSDLQLPDQPTIYDYLLLNFCKVR